MVVMDAVPNPNLVKTVTKDRVTFKKISDLPQEKVAVRCVCHYYYHKRQDKLVRTTAYLMTGLTRNGNRYWFYEDYQVDVVKRSRLGYLYTITKDTRPKGEKKWWSGSAFRLFDFDEDVMIDVYGGFGLLFPHAHHWGYTGFDSLRYLASDLNAALQAPTELGVGDRIFGARRNNDKFTAPIFGSSQDHLILAKCLRGFVPDDRLLEFLKLNNEQLAWAKTRYNYSQIEPTVRRNLRKLKLGKRLLDEPLTPNNAGSVLAQLSNQRYFNFNSRRTIKTWREI